MKTVLTVITAATVPDGATPFLTLSELRSSAGVSDSSQDTKLLSIGEQVAASICAECNIAVASDGTSTLLRERVSDTLYGVCVADMVLSRRHAVSVQSVTVDDVLISASDYIVEAESGLLTRLSGGNISHWAATKIVVIYDAGFAVIPADLKQAASDFVRMAYNETLRDPSLRAERVNIPGVEEIERTFWVGSIPGVSAESAVPENVGGQLKRFRNASVEVF